MDIEMPQMGESVTEGTVTRWFKKAGEAVKRDEALLEISTDKVDSEIPAPIDGVLEEILVGEGMKVPINTVIARIRTGDTPSSSLPGPVPKVSADEITSPKNHLSAQSSHQSEPRRDHNQGGSADPSSSSGIRLSPVVRRMVAEHKIDIRQLIGTGESGRVTRRDVLAYLDAPRPVQSSPVSSSASSASRQNTMSLNDRRETMTPMRQAIANHMVESVSTSPHAATVWEVDIYDIDKIRNKYKESFKEAYGASLTYMPFILTAVAEALRKYPIVNSQIDGNDIIYKGNINLGVAVAVEKGLIVPVIAHADNLNFQGLARHIADLAHRARGAKLLPDELSGGTFTVTNAGRFGSLYGIPIINQPQSAILCIGGVKKYVAVVDGDDASSDDGPMMMIRKRFFMSLSFDHRIIDGEGADSFMKFIETRLSTWQTPIM